MKKERLDTSALDQNWLEVSRYLANRLKTTEAVLAPDGLRNYLNTQNFQNYFSSTYLKAEDFDWVILHKGMIAEIDSTFLDGVDRVLNPVFANEVFVVFSSQKNWLILFLKLLLKRSNHLKVYYAIRETIKSSKIQQKTTLLNDKQQEIILTKRFLRSADILLCSYPKSGRTWLRFMLASYFSLLQKSSEPMDFRQMDQLVPSAWKSKNELSKLEESHVLQSDKETNSTSSLPLVVATHLSYSNRRLQIIFSCKDIIFLVRNIYDVLVSQYFELVHRRGDQSVDDIWAYICEKELLNAYVDYLNGWANHLVGDRHLVLTYENLKKDTRAEFVRVIQFLNIEFNDELISQAIALSSFENMQRLQREKRERRGIDDTDSNFAGLRIRRGKIGGYRDFLKDSEVAFIQDYCEQHLTPAAKQLLSSHGLEI